MSELTPVQQYYKGKTVFITGASGFMGKVLLEKIMYSCTEVKEIIMICRAKRGKTPESRLEDMYKLPVSKKWQQKNNNNDYYISNTIGVFFVRDSVSMEHFSVSVKLLV